MHQENKFKISGGVVTAIVVGLIFAVGVVSGFRFFTNFVRAEFYKYAVKYTSDNDQPEMGGPAVESDLEENSGHYKILDEEISFPSLTAGSYVVADLETGEILAEKAADVVYPIASITKLMTALVSTESLNQEKEVFIGREAVETYGSQGNLSVGEKISLDDLLYPMLLESSNDTAEAIAIHSGRKFFIKNMNYRASLIGMENTYFEDPSGLSAHNVSTAMDYFKLLQEINKERDYIFYITREKKYSIDGHTWHNTSRFLDDDNYVGGKNGYTDEAQHTLVTVFDLPLTEFDTRRIAVVLLNDTSVNEAERDTRRAILYLLQNVYFEKSEE